MKPTDILFYLKKYQNTSTSFLLYSSIRMLLCPFDRIIQFVPYTGKLLDIGCGAGIWLNILKHRRPRLLLEGIDIDPRKIKFASSTFNKDISFTLCTDMPASYNDSYDIITTIDVCCLLSQEDSTKLLSSAHRALKRGGKIIIKDVAPPPAYKCLITAAEEYLAVKVFRITSAEGVYIKPTSYYLTALAEHGFTDIRFCRIDKNYPHPHTVITATKA